MYVCLSVCLYVCLSVCLRVLQINHKHDTREMYGKLQKWEHELVDFMYFA